MLPIHEGWIVIPAIVCAITASPNMEHSEMSINGHLQDVKNVPHFESISQVHLNTDSMKRGTACSNDIHLYLQGVLNGKEWALRMLDASSKLSSGFFKGNLVDLGMYNECLEVHSEVNGTKVQGRHCEIIFSVSPLKSLTFSVCVPASCNADDVVQIMESNIGLLPVLKQAGLTVAGGICSDVETKPLGVGEITTMSLLLLIVLFTVACTIYDLMKRKFEYRGSILLDIVCAFSLYSNAMRLMSTKISSDTMPAIHGIRFLSIAWVVFGHHFYIGMFGPFLNKVDVVEWWDKWYSFYIRTSFFAVDTFLVLSGFLMTYVVLNQMAKGQKFNLLAHYFYRFIRLTPSLGAMILLSIYVLPLLGSGPYWNSSMGSIANKCRRYWWADLLYVQNFVSKREMCLSYTWYLAVDMQLYILSPMILYPLHRWPRIGLTIIGLFFGANTIASAFVAATNGYSIALVDAGKSFDDVLVEFEKAYITTYTRAAPWLMGVLLGYIMIHKKLQLNRMQNAAGWILSIFLLTFCAFASHKPDKQNVIWNTIVFTLARPFWGAAIAWIIYTCTQGYGGPINAILSLPVFFPLSRLSYCIYLVHYMVQTMKTAAAKTPAYFSNFNTFDFFLSDLAMAIATAFVLSLLFESPIAVLVNIGRKKRSTDERANREE